MISQSQSPSKGKQWIPRRSPFKKRTGDSLGMRYVTFQKPNGDMCTKLMLVAGSAGMPSSTAFPVLEELENDHNKGGYWIPAPSLSVLHHHNSSSNDNNNNSNNNNNEEKTTAGGIPISILTSKGINDESSASMLTLKDDYDYNYGPSHSRDLRSQNQNKQKDDGEACLRAEDAVEAATCNQEEGGDVELESQVKNMEDHKEIHKVKGEEEDGETSYFGDDDLTFDHLDADDGSGAIDFAKWYEEIVQPVYKPGEKVWVKFGEAGRAFWYRGAVLEILSPGIYNILWDDRDKSCASRHCKQP
jgi:hypothetical protein